MHGGEIWWANLTRLTGSRLGLLLSRESVYNTRSSVTVAAVTRTIRGIPVEVPLGPEDGMPTKCVINLDEITTALKSRLTERITTLSQEKLTMASQAAIFALDLMD